MLKRLLLTTILGSVAPALFADTTTVNWSTGASFTLQGSDTLALSQGAAATNQDGKLVELGYFSAGTTGSNFSGTWIPLTTTTTIGDSSDGSGSGAGKVDFTTTFSTGTKNVDVYDQDFDSNPYTTLSSVTISLTTPAVGQVLAIRFFDTVTGTTGHFNTVSADSWLWQTPSGAGASFTLNLTSSSASLEWEGGPASAQRTTLSAVPEPGSLTFIGIGLVGLMARRRKS